MKKHISFENVELGGFWKERFEINRTGTIPMVYKRFFDTGRFDAFKCDWKEGMPNKPHIFWDSDVAKWIEGVAYSIMQEPDEELERIVEETIDQIEKNQWEDGYFNSYYTVCEPDNRFTNRDNHELYCAGHLLEAAIAWKKATGRDRFLKIMERYMDLINRIFIEEDSAKFNTPGHEEIELALFKAYEETGNEKYLKMGQHFIEKRGRCEKDLNCRNWCDERYDQTDVPVRELPSAFGHAVRACYLYSGMADLARLTNDKSLVDACDRLFDNISEKRMYITGGIGSSSKGECITDDYDLPNNVAYSETCAAIALAMFARRMSAVSPDRKYDEVAERAIYNSVLSGVALDGKSFFYVNPLEINHRQHFLNTTYRESKENLLDHRIEVFGCSCCPPNIARFVPSIADYIYSGDGDIVYIHQFIESRASFDDIKITQKTEYPNNGDIFLSVEGMKGKKLAIRIPSFSIKSYINGEEVKADEKGYCTFDISEDETGFEINFEMKPKFIVANPELLFDSGKVAVCRGPLVYCVESNDNDDVRLTDIAIDLNGEFEENFDGDMNAFRLVADGYKEKHVKGLYAEYSEDNIERIKINLIPYFGFANNGVTDMEVWINRGAK